MRPGATTCRTSRDLPTPSAASEIHLIETFAPTRVIGLTINHEQMDVDEVEAAVVDYEAGAGHPGHRCAAHGTGPARRHGARCVPRARGARRSPSREGPRLEIRLDAVAHNTTRHGAATRRTGHPVTAVTKASLGVTRGGGDVPRGRLRALADSRLANVRRLRRPGIRAPVTLLRTPMLERGRWRRGACDISCNTEPAVLAALSVAAVAAASGPWRGAHGGARRPARGDHARRPVCGGRRGVATCRGWSCGGSARIWPAAVASCPMRPTWPSCRRWRAGSSTRRTRAADRLGRELRQPVLGAGCRRTWAGSTTSGWARRCCWGVIRSIARPIPGLRTDGATLSGR